MNKSKFLIFRFILSFSIALCGIVAIHSYDYIALGVIALIWANNIDKMKFEELNQ